MEKKPKKSLIKEAVMKEAVLFASRLRFKFLGEDEEGQLKLVLVAINERYKKERSRLTPKGFERWKEKNQDMVDWYMGLYKQYKPEESALSTGRVKKVVAKEQAEAQEWAEKLKVDQANKTAAGLTEEVLHAISVQIQTQKATLPKKGYKKWEKENQEMVSWYLANYNGGDKKKVKKVLKKVKKGDSKKTSPASTVNGKELSCFGHDKHSQRGYIDAALAKGTTKEAMIAHLVKAFGIGKKTSVGKVRRYTKYLQDTEGVKIVEKKGVLTATA